MKPNPFKQLIKKYIVNEIHVPTSLVNVTSIDHESEVSHASEKVNRLYVQIWKALEAIYQTGIFPGISLCLRHQGEIRINRSIGHLSGNGPQDESWVPKVPLSPSSPICLFSASKAITAMLLHKLVELGEIHLDDPVSKFMSNFRRGQSPSILQILSHQAGIPRLPLEQGVETIFHYEQMVEHMLTLQPEWEAGERVGYHAVTGGYLLGEIVRKVAAMPVEAYLEQAIAKPLGMKYFTYGVRLEDSDKVAKNEFTGFPVTPPVSTILKNALGVPVEEVVALSNDPRFHTAVIPAANVMATAEEVSRFFQVLLDEGRWNDQFVFNKDTIVLAKRAQSKLTIDYMLKVPMRYSAGMMLGENPVSLFGPFTKNAFGHLGFTNNICWADPDRSVSVGLLTTGKAVFGSHLPKLLKLLVQIANLPK